MPNPNKAKGDRAERAVRDWVLERFPDSFKTRAGFNDDLGDVIVAGPRLPGRFVLQVKDVATPTWAAWFAQVREQVDTCVRASRPIPVLGGAVVHKARGVADPARWRAVMELGDLLDTLETAYRWGYAAGQEGDRG